MADVIKLPSPQRPLGADEAAQAETEHKQRLFDWGDTVLKGLGFDKKFGMARSILELHRITFDADSAEVALAIRDALYPASGRREEHFRHLKEGTLKQILKARFAQMKKDREAELNKRRKASEPSWEDDLILDPRTGNIKPVVANLTLILRESPKWKGVLAYDEFAAQVMIRKTTPWGDGASHWTDHRETQTRIWFQRMSINPTLGDVGRAVQAAARHNQFHPVRDHFASLSAWDGKARLDTWLQTYFHVADSEYVRAIGSRWIMSGVARIYQPGCQADHMLVLEGDQGKQKSTALRHLAIKDEWFADRVSHIGSKDAQLELTGVLLIEIAEMDTLRKAASGATKSFLTRREERFRPPYGKHTIKLPRQCVFAGTINPPVGGYLKDPTGARRYWPVTCHGKIDLEGLKRNRDQLWAEAIHRYKADMPWWLETDELEALATAEQEARFVVDAWDEPIRTWINNRIKLFGQIDVSLPEVLEHIGLAREHHNQTAQNRVVSILTSMGFKKYRARHGAVRENRYRRD
jgi:predicted P-loop ATPase